MKIVVIMDKFKESLSAREAADAISDGLRASGNAGLKNSDSALQICSIPLADGGDGTIEALEDIAGGERVVVKSLDPLGREIDVPVLRMGDRFICEMAKSTGLTLLSKGERDPLLTSSYGLGMVIKAIAAMRAQELIIGIGGSATNDCGVGMLQALGYRFYERSGGLLGGSARAAAILKGEDMMRIAGIDDSMVDATLRGLKITVANDVINPLTGVYGATQVYGPQKGATPAIVEELEAGVVNFAGVAAKFLGKDYSKIPGSGAAGGVGFALGAFLGAELRQGWRVLFDMLDVEEMVKEADLVITGEGRVDGQSLSGKLIDGVRTICKKYERRLWVICGDNLLTERELKQAGIEQLYAISQIEPVKALAIKNARQHLYDIILYLCNAHLKQKEFRGSNYLDIVRALRFNRFPRVFSSIFSQFP